MRLEFIKLIAFTLLLFLGNLIYSQQVILTEDFNNGIPTGWELIDNDGLSPNASPSVNFITEAFMLVEDEDSTGLGDSVLISNSWFDGSGTADDYLILPSVTLGNYGNYISFDAKSYDHSYPCALEVRASTGLANVWDFYNLAPAFDTLAVSPYWTNYRVSLDSIGITGETVRIAFRHNSTDQFILAIDNIQIEIDDPVAVPSIASSSILVNTVSHNGSFQLNNNQSTSYRVFDLKGQLIDQGVTYNSIELKANKGMYLLYLEDYKPERILIQ